MSTSEKLKAADIRWWINAREEIVAVVEAADKAAVSLHLEAHVGDVFRLSSALRDLDEALS